MAFTLDTYTEDVPDLDEAAAQEISEPFIGIPGFDWDHLKPPADGDKTDTEGGDDSQK